MSDFDLPLDDDTLSRLAYQWWEEEWANEPERPVGFGELPDKEADAVFNRVKRVLAGYIPRDQLSPGDRAIFAGRFRWLPEDLPGVLERHKGEAHWKNWYDGAIINAPNSPSMELLFSNSNLGDRVMTNLDLPGQLAFRKPVYLVSWYLRSNKPLPAQFLAMSNASLVVGDRTEIVTPLAELVTPQRALIDVPASWNFRCLLSLDHESRPIDQAADRWERDARAHVLWIHLEGAWWRTHG